MAVRKKTIMITLGKDVEKLRLSYIADRNVENFGKQVGHYSEIQQSHPQWLSSSQDNIGRNRTLFSFSIWQVKCVLQNMGSYVTSRDGNQLKKKGMLSFSGPERDQKPRFHFISGRKNLKNKNKNPTKSSEFISISWLEFSSALVVLLKQKKDFVTYRCFQRRLKSNRVAPPAWQGCYLSGAEELSNVLASFVCQQIESKARNAHTLEEGGMKHISLASPFSFWVYSNELPHWDEPQSCLLPIAVLWFTRNEIQGIIAAWAHSPRVPPHPRISVCLSYWTSWRRHLPETQWILFLSLWPVLSGPLVHSTLWPYLVSS